MVLGEGAAAFVMESGTRAERRGARIWARVLGASSSFEPGADKWPWKGTAIRHSIVEALRAAGLQDDQVGHVNANGLSTREHDRVEAQAISDCLGTVPVTAPKSFFGNLGAGAGAVETIASVLALSTGQVPVTLNYEQPDPECPVRVVHGKPRPADHPTALVINQATTGQAAAVVLAAP
jgi:3-oxoacyl-[acyl-carrier-protein] synthase II